MAFPQGLATFNGVNSCIAASYNRVHGISPGICMLTTAPQEDFVPLDGDLTFTFGDTVFTFKNCRIDRAHLSVDEEWRWTLQIMDRRWKWRSISGGGQISGAYNLWRDNFTLQDGNVDPNQANTQTNVINTEQTPQQLASLCLDAMGETGYDVSALPAEVRPTVVWDFDNPADALAALCEDMGCHIFLGLDDVVHIVTIGEGAQLPQDGIMHPDFTIDPPDMPDKIIIVCSPTRYQIDFQLEAVGLDNPINGDPSQPTDVGIPGNAATVTGPLVKPLPNLSYAPINWPPLVQAFAGDLGDTTLGGFTQGDMAGGFLLLVGKNDTNGHDITGLRNLAQSSVGKLYRIKTPVRVPNGDTQGDRQITILQQILPLEQEQVNAWIINYEQENIPAAIFGVFFDWIGDANNSQPTLQQAPVLSPGFLPPATRTIFYRKPFQIDATHGLVSFSEPVYMNVHPLAADGLQEPPKCVAGAAQLVLRTACQVRDSKTLAIDRYTRSYDTGANSGTKARYILREEIALNIIPKYDSTGYSTIYKSTDPQDPRAFTGVVSNLTEVNAACDLFIQAALKEYQSTEAQQLSYLGLREDIELDGAIMHLSYTVGAGGCFTHAARNTEMLNRVLSYREMRRIQRNRVAAAHQRDQAIYDKQQGLKARAFFKHSQAGFY
jgi:hypothetical protein